ncbi:MAG: exodeoxyribonuclease VII large subunit [Acidobacteriota bacterium]
MSHRLVRSGSLEETGAAGPRIYQVREINRSARALLESAFRTIWLEGEISNFRRFAGSGHWYFTLKDAGAQIAAAMFASRNRSVRFTPKDGMHVLARGTVSLYEPRGTFQILVSRIEPRGAGALQAAFEQLRSRLADEGLFDEDRKQSLPLVPRRIGVVTSRDGAALRDILRILAQRHAGVSVLLFPTRVQGAGAAEEIAGAISTAARTPGLDVLIVGRGGGNLEDLWAFNEEIVARAIAACQIPVISAVGHEVDVTIADLVADCRAATPSAAAERVVASREQMLDRVHGLTRRLAGSIRLTIADLRGRPASHFPVLAARHIQTRLHRATQRLDEMTARLSEQVAGRVARYRERLVRLAARLSPASLAAIALLRRTRAEQTRDRLVAALRRRVERARNDVAGVAGRLGALSPLAVLERGYALVRLAEETTLLRDASQAPPGTRLHVRLHRGHLDARVLASDDGGADQGPPSRRPTEPRDG